MKKSLERFKPGELIRPVENVSVSFEQDRGFNEKFLEFCNNAGRQNHPFLFLDVYSYSVHWDPNKTSYDVMVMFLFQEQKIRIRRIFPKDNYQTTLWRYNNTTRTHGKLIWHWTEWFERV